MSETGRSDNTSLQWPDIDQMWERACSRKRLNIQHFCWLILRFREQARSHIGLCVTDRPYAWPHTNTASPWPMSPLPMR
ncbi:hypothetical protein F7R14_04165 [Pseudomonas lini]|uniref:Uncharacterized protein n=1 Tax=Pseudomonas lini TaxID=163011 RepID=A0A7V7TN79_9PSED|nr:hypothetical protein F7R14_04165 [Pseudomonas lini]MDT9673063.1 hypothetical protein [Pseudomonas sp. JV414]